MRSFFLGPFDLANGPFSRPGRGGRCGADIAFRDFDHLFGGFFGSAVRRAGGLESGLPCGPDSFGSCRRVLREAVDERLRVVLVLLALRLSGRSEFGLGAGEDVVNVTAVRLHFVCHGLRVAGLQREQLLRLFGRKRLGQEFLIFGLRRFDHLQVQLNQLSDACETFGQETRYRFETDLLRGD
jgi:hypothetical protein